MVSVVTCRITQIFMLLDVTPNKNCHLRKQLVCIRRLELLLAQSNLANYHSPPQLLSTIAIYRPHINRPESFD